uniref:DNA-directed RNA polymerase n=1 Tax=Aegilops tauschii TaxID=37682 RepID=R7WAX4_AEGTA
MGSNLREILDNVSYPEIFLSFPNAKENKRIESKEKSYFGVLSTICLCRWGPGPGGLKRRTASFRSRDIHPSHYGRIFPIDTSEGINVGLAGSLAIHARIDHLRGSIESLFYEISAEKAKEKKRQVVYLSPNRDEYYMIAAGNSLSLNQGIQEEQVVPARYRQEFLTIAWEQIHVRSIFPFQYFSIGGSLIPFIEHNDANRALMSSNMQRQAVPLSRSEKCIVGTGLERQIALDSRVSIIAEREGKIISTDSHKILLSSSGKTISIPLVNHRRSNKNTCMHQKPRVPQGKSIQKGQILAEGAATVGVELDLGKNLLVAYMPWEGYNFEDAVIISERLVYEDIYTSFHIRKYEIQMDTTSQGSAEKITKEIPHLEEHLLHNLDKNGVVRLGSWVETGDILVGVPSQMNVGQIFESSLELAGDLLKKHYRIAPFDERYEQEASRKLVFSELYEASKETKSPWVFEPEYPGKSRIFDGRTGDPFEQHVLIGKSCILKLIHQVDEKIHGCSTGPYSLVTQQPVRGRAKQGGQRVGEMEVWALEGFGVAHILQEILTYKSDHLIARQEILNATIWGKRIPNHEDPPESFRVLVRELRSLALELNHFLVSEKNFQVNREEV